MKTIIALLFGIALLSNTALADWNSISSGTTSNITNIEFINNQVGYYVASTGVVGKSTNGGLSWTILTVPTVSNLYGICFPSSSVGYISGGNATTSRMLKTTDGGNSWAVLNFPVSTILRDVSFINEMTGYAVGGNKTIVKTTDGGSTWIIQMQSGTIAFTKVKAFSALDAICCNMSGLIYKTTDGGVTWLSKTSPTTENLSSMDFVNETHGYIVGGNFVLKTINQGEDWEMFPIPGASGLASVKFLTPSTGFVVGSNGLIMKTTNAGVSWTSEISNTSESILAIESTSSNLHVAGGNGYYSQTANPIGIQNINSEIPKDYKLSQNYPNPFNPLTNIEFSIPSKGNVKLTVFDIAGKEVGLLVNNVLSPGTYRFDFNANYLSSGTYFYRLVAGDYVETKKMVLVK